VQYGFQSYAGRGRSRSEFVRLPEGVEQPLERLKGPSVLWMDLIIRLVSMSYEFLVTLDHYSQSFVVGRVTPLLLFLL
jgi:hypothetical protein